MVGGLWMLSFTATERNIQRHRADLARTVDALNILRPHMQSIGSIPSVGWSLVYPEDAGLSVCSRSRTVVCLVIESFFGGNSGANDDGSANGSNELPSPTHEGDRSDASDASSRGNRRSDDKEEARADRQYYIDDEQYCALEMIQDDTPIQREQKD